MLIIGVLHEPEQVAQHLVGCRGGLQSLLGLWQLLIADHFGRLGGSDNRTGSLALLRGGRGVPVKDMLPCLVLG